MMARSAAGLWLISPTLALAFAALAQSGESPPMLPEDEDKPPTRWHRIRFMILAIIPWVVLYEFTANMHLPGTAFKFAFEDKLPIWLWTAPIYQSIYPAVAATPWLARSRRDLRRLTLSVWIALIIVFPIYWVMPSTAPRRPLEADSWIAKVLHWERDTYPPTAAFPSFHVLWVIFIARVWRPMWLGVAYATAVTLSCVTTGMHYIPDLLVSIAMAPFMLEPERLWRRMREHRDFLGNLLLALITLRLWLLDCPLPLVAGVYAVGAGLLQLAGERRRLGVGLVAVCALLTCLRW
jgi:hypothetical protein